MASVLDVSLIGFFQPFFLFLIIFALIYGILEKTEMFGKGKSALHLIIAICIAASTIVVKSVSGILGSALPWFVLIFTVLLLIFMIYGFFGIESKRVWGMIGYTPLLLIIIGIIGALVLTTFQTQLSPYAGATPGTETVSANVSSNATSPTPTSETLKTLTNPKVIGALLLLLLTAAAAKLIVDKVKVAP